MDEKNYKLSFLPIFEDDLNSIVDYIDLKLQNPDASKRLVDEIFAAILKRVPYAESFEVYPSKRMRKLKYYRIHIRRYTVFYVVQDGVMEVRRIFHSRMNWVEKL